MTLVILTEKPIKQSHIILYLNTSWDLTFLIVCILFNMQYRVDIYWYNATKIVMIWKSTVPFPYAALCYTIRSHMNLFCHTDVITLFCFLFGYWYRLRLVLKTWIIWVVSLLARIKQNKTVWYGAIWLPFPKQRCVINVITSYNP